MDAAEFVELGNQIMQHGAELKTRRAERDKLNAEIEALEAKLQPLLVRHSQLVAEMVGAARPPPPRAAPAATTVVATPATPSPGVVLSTDEVAASAVERKKLAARIMKLIENSDANLSSLEISERLQVDGVLVREVMRELRDR